jgi:outer membrane immunogenic protein
VNKILCLAVSSLVVAFATDAGAADLDLPFKAPVPATVYNWTGCYVGANAGGGTSWSTFSDSEYYGHGTGAVAGGQVGCNYQIKKFVVGLEGELFWSGINHTYSETEPESGTAYIGGLYQDSEQSQNLWDATLALRAGFTPLDDLLIYGKLGAAWGSYRLTYNCCNYAPTYSTNETENAQATVAGLVFGAGFEYAITPNWSVKFEYEYIDYGSPKFNFTDTYGGTTYMYSYTEGENKQIVKVGFNYKLY